MPLHVMTAAEIHRSMLRDLANRVGGAAPTKGSDWYHRSAAVAEVVLGIRREVATAVIDAFVDSAEDEALDRIADIFLGPAARKGATAARGPGALRAYGATGSTVAGELGLVHADGTRLRTASAGVIGAGGYCDLDVVAVTTGTAGNKSAGEKLTFATAPAGVATGALLVDDLTGGLAAEDDENVRARVKDKLHAPPAGGRAADYRRWVRAVEAMDDAYVYCPSSRAPTARRGLGTVDIVPLLPGSGRARIPTLYADIEEAEYAVESSRPVTVRGVGWHIAVERAVDVDVVLTAQDGYLADWDDSAGYFAVAYTPATKTLQWSATAPVAVGDRIVCLGELHTVAAIPAPDETVLSADFAAVVAPGAPIYAGGPLTAPVMDAISELFDALGPARGPAADPGRSWDDTLRRAQVLAVTMAVAGVLDAEVLAPGTNVTAQDLGAGGLELLVPGEISARYA